MELCISFISLQPTYHSIAGLSQVFLSSFVSVYLRVLLLLIEARLVLLSVFSLSRKTAETIRNCRHIDSGGASAFIRERYRAFCLKYAGRVFCVLLDLYAYWQHKFRILDLTSSSDEEDITGISHWTRRSKSVIILTYLLTYSMEQSPS